MTRTEATRVFLSSFLLLILSLNPKLRYLRLRYFPSLVILIAPYRLVPWESGIKANATSYMQQQQQHLYTGTYLLVLLFLENQKCCFSCLHSSTTGLPRDLGNSLFFDTGPSWTTDDGLFTVIQSLQSTSFYCLYLTYIFQFTYRQMQLWLLLQSIAYALYYTLLHLMPSITAWICLEDVTFVSHV